MKKKFQNILIKLGFIKKIIIPTELKEEFYDRCKFAIQHYNKTNNINEYNSPNYIEIDWIMKYKCGDNNCCFTIKAIRNKDILALFLVVILYLLTLIFIFNLKTMENNDFIIKSYVLISVFFIPLTFFRILNIKHLRDKIFLIIDQVSRNILEKD